jgi:hypothetical protein
MKYIDADGHVEECPTTFSDQYLEPAFRPQRPSVIGRDGLAYWVIDEQMFPQTRGARLQQSRHACELRRNTHKTYSLEA